MLWAVYKQDVSSDQSTMMIHVVTLPFLPRTTLGCEHAVCRSNRLTHTLRRGAGLRVNVHYVDDGDAVDSP